MHFRSKLTELLAPELDTFRFLWFPPFWRPHCGRQESRIHFRFLFPVGRRPYFRSQSTSLSPDCYFRSYGRSKFEKKCFGRLEGNWSLLFLYASEGQVTSTNCTSAPFVSIPITNSVEKYQPVSRYHSADDWGQVTSPVTQPRVWTLNDKWNEAASAQRNMLTLSSWRGNSSTCLSLDELSADSHLHHIATRLDGLPAWFLRLETPVLNRSMTRMFNLHLHIHRSEKEVASLTPTNRQGLCSHGWLTSVQYLFTRVDLNTINPGSVSKVSRSRQTLVCLEPLVCSFTTATDHQRIDAFFGLSKRCAFCQPDLSSFNVQWVAADEKLLKAMPLNSSHILHCLLPTVASQDYNLMPRT